jgi:hypothetical protein
MYTCPPIKDNDMWRAQDTEVGYCIGLHNIEAARFIKLKIDELITTTFQQSRVEYITNDELLRKSFRNYTWTSSGV